MSMKHHIDILFSSAERRGFEPRIPFRGIHAFQACLFNHSSISPFRVAKVMEVFETAKYSSTFSKVVNLRTNPPERKKHSMLPYSANNMIYNIFMKCFFAP